MCWRGALQPRDGRMAHTIATRDIHQRLARLAPCQSLLPLMRRELGAPGPPPPKRANTTIGPLTTKTSAETAEVVTISERGYEYHRFEWSETCEFAAIEFSRAADPSSFPPFRRESPPDPHPTDVYLGQSRHRRCGSSRDHVVSSSVICGFPVS
jgi:hypothetical protein